MGFLFRYRNHRLGACLLEVVLIGLLLLISSATSQVHATQTQIIAETNDLLLPGSGLGIPEGNQLVISGSPITFFDGFIGPNQSWWNVVIGGSDAPDGAIELPLKYTTGPTGTQGVEPSDVSTAIFNEMDPVDLEDKRFRGAMDELERPSTLVADPSKWITMGSMDDDGGELQSSDMTIPLRLILGTADAAGYEDSPPSSITIPRNNWSTDIAIQTVDDMDEEHRKTFTVEIDEAQFQADHPTIAVANQKSVESTITDNDGLAITWSADPNPVYEGESTTLTMTLSRPLPVRVGNSGRVQTETIYVVIDYSGDSYPEGNATDFNIPLEEYRYGSTGGTMDFHHDPDNPGFSFKTASIELDIKQDKETEGTEKLVWKRKGTGGSREGAQELYDAPCMPKNCWYAIEIKEKPTVTLSAEPTTVEEGEKVVVKATISEAQSEDVTVHLNYPNAPATDTATKTDDYTAFASITIKANETSGTGEIPTIDDDLEEDSEHFTVVINEKKLTDSHPMILVGEPKSKKITITDNDRLTITWSADPNPVYEGESTTLTMTLSKPLPWRRKKYTNAIFVVAFPWHPNGGSYNDYDIPNKEHWYDPNGTHGSMVFYHDPDNPGYLLQTASIVLDIKQDDKTEGTEDLIWRRDGAGSDVGDVATRFMTSQCIPESPIPDTSNCAYAITIKERPTVTLSAEPTTVEEGEKVVVKATISEAQSEDVTVHLNYPNAHMDTATKTDDYTALPSITIKANETSGTGEIPTIDDDLEEDSEHFRVVINEKKFTDSYPTMRVGKPKSKKITITDNDKMVIHLVANPLTVSEGETVTMQLKLTKPVTQSANIEVRRNTSSTADTEDYTITNGVADQDDPDHLWDFSFQAGKKESDTATINIERNSDTQEESLIFEKLPNANGPGAAELSNKDCVPSDCRVTITIKGTPAVSISATSPVAEGDPVTVTATLSEAFSSDLEIPLTLSHEGDLGTAEDGDYDTLDKIVISAADLEGIGTIQTNEDEDYDDETFTVAIDESSLASSVVAVDPKTVMVTITDADQKPEASFASSSFELEEDDITYNVSVNISPAPVADLTLTYSLKGTADENKDYSISNSGMVSATAGQISVDIPVKVIDDAVNENDETVILTLTGGTGYSVGAPDQHTLTITDNDIPEVSFVSAADRVSEGVGTRNVSVNISPAPVADLTLTYSLRGTADENKDYSISNSGMVSATAGETSVDIPVKIINDAVNENDETVILTLTGGTGYNLGSPLAHTLTIVDDDDITPPTSVTVTLSASPTSVEEGESVTVTAMLSPPLSDAVTITLRYEPGEPPTEPSDYDPLGQITIPGGSQSESGTIYIQDDDISEGEERFTVAINGSWLPSGVKLGSPSSVEIMILDDDPPPPVEVSLSVSSNSVDEGELITVTATLTGVLEEDVAVPLVYNYDETNQPPENGDYIPLSNITIFRGETEGSGEIQTIRDTDAEDEIFIVALGDLPPDLLQLGRETFQEVTIRDITSSEVIVNLSAVPNSVEEGKSVTVTATLSEVHDTDVTIPLTVADGTAEKDEDYQASPPTRITINAGKTRGIYSILTVADEIEEDDETFTVALGPLPSRLANGEQSLVTVTIIDNDEAGIKVVPPSVEVVEGGEASFDLSLTSKPLGEVVVTMIWPSGTDLTLQPITRTFTPETWQTKQQVTLSAKVDADLVDDPVEVTLTASGSSDYSGISETVFVTIRDKDTAGLVVNPLSVTMNEGTERTLEIALTQKPSGPVTVNFSGHLGTDLSLSVIPLTFTTSNWNQAQTVTLTAAKDEDIVDDTATLTLTASGGGYDGVTKTVPVTIEDIDEAGIVVERIVTMEEGGTHPLMVRLLAQPSGPVTVTFSGHAGTDLSLSVTPLTFTTSNWNQAQTVTLTAAEDEDYETDTIELNLAASGGGYNGEDAPVTVTITDNDERPGPLTITIYDKRELEDAGAIQLPIELSRPTDAVVTVQYASTDGTAESGLDYTASRGIVIFDPGATRGVIEIEITDDEIPESTETFAVTLLKPQNAIIARGTGTGTILDNDGGTAILRVEDTLVQEEEGMVRFQVSLSHPQRQMISAAYRTQDGTAKAGEDYEAASGVVTLAPGTLDAMIAVPLLKDGLDWQEETFTVHLESSENAEIAKAVGVATIQAATTVSQEALEAYTARFVRTSATQVVEALGDRFHGADGTACGAATRAEMSRLWYSASSWDPSLGELLGGCRMSATSYSGSFSVWGRGAFRQFNGREDDGLALDGEVTTGMLGADYRWKGGWLAGVLLSHSQGEGSFAAAQESGEITAGLTGVYPYVSVARAGWEVWLSAGAGRGQAEVLELDGDLTSRFGAMGVRGTLVSNSTIGLNYHGDVLVTDAEIEEHAVTAEVYRVRAGVEANARINNVLRPYVEANVRSDGGSAETGVGLEFGGGMRIAYPAWRLRGDVHAQGLVMHTAAGFSEWGISGFVQVGNRSEGLMMRVRPSWGLGQGMSLYGQQTIRDAAPMGTGVHRTELELGYGVPWKEGSARSIMGMTQLSQGRMYRLGGELHPWERLTFSVFGLAHSRAASLGDIGVNVRGSLRY